MSEVSRTDWGRRLCSEQECAHCSLGLAGLLFYPIYSGSISHYLKHLGEKKRHRYLSGCVRHWHLVNSLNCCVFNTYTSIFGAVELLELILIARLTGLS